MSSDDIIRPDRGCLYSTGEKAEVRAKMTGGRSQPSANDIQHGGTHYQTAPVQHWDFVKMHNIPYMEACVIKYVMRHKSKNGLEDLKKAQHFIQKIIEQEYSNE